VDERGYVKTVERNLRQPLSAKARAAFEAGDGGELTDSRSRPAKMRALHSSSALAVNVFDFWTTRDPAPLAKALQLDHPIVEVAFEGKLGTGLPGNPPNLDVVLTCAHKTVVAIESKFTEWMSAKPRRHAAFKPKYFPADAPLWLGRGLPKAQQLAEERRHFTYLDVPQLLKHTLGLKSQDFVGSSLLYLYFDAAGPEAEEHRREIARFQQQLDAAVGFRALTYQDLVARLAAARTEDMGPYLEYLTSRYVGAATVTPLPDTCPSAQPVEPVSSSAPADVLEVLTL
jgi:hypothetical protein